MKSLSAMLIFFMATSVAASPPSEVRSDLRDAGLRGEVQVGWLVWDLYTARLWTRDGAELDLDQPFALSLTYEIDFTVDELAGASVDEIARITGLPRDAFVGLGDTLRTCFKDVTEGDRITGVSLGPDQAAFYFNGTKTCDVNASLFSERFFGIWLGPKTRDPKAQKRLLGASR